MAMAVWAAIRIICYLAFFIVTTGLLSYFLVFEFNLCQGKGSLSFTVKCVNETWRTVFEFGFTVFLVTVASYGIPIIMAIAGFTIGIGKMMQES